MKTRTLVCLVTLAAAPAWAQQSGRPYLGLTVGTHVERSDDVRGSSAAVGVVGGIPLNRRWSLEVEAARPTSVFTRTTALFRWEREVASSVSVGAAFQEQVHPRIAPRLFIGVTNHHVVDRMTAFTTKPAEQQYSRNLGGVAVGAGAAFALIRHVSIAPEVRYDYGSIGDEINNAWRTSLRAVWSF